MKGLEDDVIIGKRLWSYSPPSLLAPLCSLAGPVKQNIYEHKKKLTTACSLPPPPPNRKPDLQLSYRLTDRDPQDAGACERGEQHLTQTSVKMIDFFSLKVQLQKQVLVPNHYHKTTHFHCDVGSWCADKFCNGSISQGALRWFSKLHQFGITVICFALQWNMKGISGHNSALNEKRK